ncbi:MAG TPA: ribonuclease III domain-containing protein [Bacilli bacterium]|nr:ribonuclease III domain-containing protein [Bacilli bacterium]
MNTDLVNTIALAYLGDGVYELLVRNYLISKGINNVNLLQKESLKFVTAKSQSDILNKIISKLTLEEQEIIKRGRNAKINSKPKSCDILTYKHATAFETLFGYLYLKNKKDRIEEIFNFIKEEVKC